MSGTYRSQSFFYLTGNRKSVAGNLFVHSFVSSTLAPSTASFLQKINTSETMSAQLYFTFSGQPHASAVAVEFLAMYSESLWCWPRFMVFLQRARCGCDFHEQMASKHLQLYGKAGRGAWAALVCWNLSLVVWLDWAMAALSEFCF